MTLANLGVIPSTARRAALSGRFRETRVDLLPRLALADIGFVVDLGANVGRWSTQLLDICSPTRLIAVEPSPDVLPTLRSALARYARTEVVAAAVGATNGTIKFNVTAHSHSASVLQPRVAEMNAIYGYGYEVKRTVKVPLRTLDKITGGRTPVDLLKIDVQGYEPAVLEGGSETLALTRWVLCEVTFKSHYENDVTFPRFDGLIGEHGFTLRAMSEPSIWSGTSMWADALYERAK